MTTLMPDGFYRPIPIVWFTAAVAANGVVLALLYMGPIAFFRAEPTLISIAAGLWLIYLIYRIWPRKMVTAAKGWQIATGAILAAQFAIFLFAAANRPPCEQMFADPHVKCEGYAER